MNTSIRWSDFKTWQKVLLVKVGLVEIGAFIVAWTDLNRRSPELINGNKKLWRAALFLNGIGPLAYFTKGRKKSTWTEDNIPSMQDKIAIVTGANSGIGYETTRALAQHGATVVMACRNMEKAERAAEQIRALNPRGNVVVMQLDLADLASVHSFTESFKAQYDRLDLLINNAGIMVPPLGRTEQGFETQFGVNHLGHFALTADLIDLLNRTHAARVVTISSTAHRFGTIDFADLNWHDRSYAAMPAYGQSKLANLLFTYELQRRLAAAGHSTLAVASHPGYAATNLQGDSTMMKIVNRVVAQPQAMGALPTLLAATGADIQGGDYYGPSGLAELAGKPEKVQSDDRSYNVQDAQRLWTVSEQLTATPFPL